MKKVALVGCGRISKRHIEAIQNTDGVEIAYLHPEVLKLSIQISL